MCYIFIFHISSIVDLFESMANVVYAFTFLPVRFVELAITLVVIFIN